MLLLSVLLTAYLDNLSGPSSSVTSSPAATVSAAVTAKPTETKPVSTPDSAVSGTDLSDINTVTPGTLTVAISPDYPPFAYTDNDDNMTGINPELLAAICDRIGLKLQFDVMDFDSSLLAVHNGTCDAVASGIIYGVGREETMDCSDIYYSVSTFLVTLEDSGITKDNLDGRMIGVVSGTSGQFYAEESFEPDKIVVYDSYYLMMIALSSHQIDCAVMDDKTAEFYAVRNDLAIESADYPTEEYVFGFVKGSDALVSAVNEALRSLEEDGTLQSILNRYLPY